MKAAFIDKTGPPEVILYGDLPEPKPGPTQCLIKVAAVDVNPIDVYIRSGAVPGAMNFPAVLGRDAAGVVVEIGSEVKRFRKGQRVWASNQGLAGRPGTFAELIAVEECWLHPSPEGVSDEDVVAVSLTGITAHLGLVRDAKLNAGEILFVNGGTGGVGSCVVQMAKALGGRVITTAGNAEKVEACRQMGADLALNYKTADVDVEIRKFAPDGVNVWWETLRDPNFERIVPLMSRRSRIIIMAGREARPIFPVGPFYTRDCSVHGFAMFNSSADEQRSAGEDINRWLKEGKLRARIDRVLPLSKAAEAHRLQEESTLGKSGALAGKIVLKPGA